MFIDDNGKSYTETACSASARPFPLPGRRDGCGTPFVSVVFFAPSTFTFLQLHRPAVFEIRMRIKSLHHTAQLSIHVHTKQPHPAIGQAVGRSTAWMGDQQVGPIAFFRFALDPFKKFQIIQVDVPHDLAVAGDGLEIFAVLQPLDVGRYRLEIVNLTPAVGEDAPGPVTGQLLKIDDLVDVQDRSIGRPGGLGNGGVCHQSARCLEAIPVAMVEVYLPIGEPAKPQTESMLKLHLTFNDKQIVAKNMWNRFCKQKI